MHTKDISHWEHAPSFSQDRSRAATAGDLSAVMV